MFFHAYTDKTDAELVSRIARSDRKAFQEILRRYQAGVYQFAVSLLKDSLEAEDISQEVFLRLYRTAETYQCYASLRAYLFRIARNLCLDHIQKKKPELMSEPPEPSHSHTPYYHLHASEVGELIQDVLSRLPENQQAAIHLRHVQGMSYREISQTLGVTVHAVESLLSRARKTLRKKMKPGVLA